MMGYTTATERNKLLIIMINEKKSQNNYVEKKPDRRVQYRVSTKLKICRQIHAEIFPRNGGGEC